MKIENTMIENAKKGQSLMKDAINWPKSMLKSKNALIHMEKANSCKNKSTCIIFTNESLRILDHRHV